VKQTDLPAKRLNDLADILEAILDVGGSLIPTEHARTLMGQQSQSLVSDAEFAAAVNALEERGILRVARQTADGDRAVGLSAAALKDIKDRIARHESLDPVAWKERQLMPALFRYLHYRFHRVLKLGIDARWRVVETASGSRRNGQWTLGDYTALEVQRSVSRQGHDLILHSFELKRSKGGNVSSVAQALRQSSMAHYGYLVWHCPTEEKTGKKFSSVVSECRQMGVGLIAFDHPQDLDSWEVLFQPPYQTRSPTIGSQFVREWLPDVDQFLA
jgi:hypothetical protein